MNACACSRFHRHCFSSRPPNDEGKRFLRGTVLLLSLLLLGSRAYAQAPLAPSTLSFGEQVLNQSSTALSATLKNTQDAPLSLKSITVSGGNAASDYALGGDCPLSPSTLGAGESCRFTVTFTPSALGSRTATLTVTRIAPDARPAPDARIAASEARRSDDADAAQQKGDADAQANSWTVALTGTGVSVAGGDTGATGPWNFVAAGNASGPAGTTPSNAQNAAPTASSPAAINAAAIRSRLCIAM